ncbi:transcription factor MYB3R-1 isoform X2 [Punica granatum]|uniref:Uncharacterized protein n=2 Tax=Punica granatum TaxID=22663 RepID=A0A218XNX4_PUNGR|nr:transcription factor MYB3R-1 isoform X2 [Punica granatum]OWM86624.1 hypothetical protein CDL15_Pgr015659 [Punica granatum]PKI66032.1 hypothetical protein CRG98_013617 [Punica granatum]
MESESASTPSDGFIGVSQKPRPLHGRTSGPTRRSTKGQWTAEEDEILRKAVERFKGKNWKKIAECFKDRTDVQCLHRWQKVLNPELVKGPWSKEEDSIIIELVNKYGPKKWSTIAQHLPGRIGKQCRERWHNHLNPAINKEAWTQEEELALIRAHQIYGNRWAELTKFLPGRTDNAIKNHWNSSVKKKLDSYIASGLLSQFPALPHPAGYQNQLAPSSSRMQSSGDDTAPKGATEAEEISECSQGSTMVVCSQSASDMVLHGREDLQYLEEPALGNEPNSSPASSSGRYYSIEDVTLSIPDICPETAHSSDLHIQFPQGIETCADQTYQFNSDNLPNISLLELGRESSAFQSQSLGADGDHDRLNAAFQPSTSHMVASSLGALGIDSDQLHHILTSDEECCRILFSEAVGDGCFGSNPKGSDSSGCGRPDISSNQALDSQISVDSRALSQQYDCPRSDLWVTSSGQSFKPVPPLSNDDGNINFDKKHNQLPDVPGAAQEDFVPHDGFIYTNNSANSPCDDATELGSAELLDLPKDQSKLVPVDTFGSTSNAPQTLKEDSNIKTEKEEPGSLCYEPPRFPSLDIPFLSCDLVQSSNDMQMDYSPLGIRQLMMSSMNCISPFRLWDSPTRDSSPDAVLKSAAKTFTNTPSILRKRHRDLLSPLSDRRIDKKLETEITANLSREFSRLDVIFDEKTTEKACPSSPSSSQKMNSGFLNDDDKENLGIDVQMSENKGDQTAISGECDQIKDNERSTFEDEKQQVVDPLSECKHKAEADASPKPMQLPEVLSERDLNDLLLFSPDPTSQKTDKASAPTAGCPRKPCYEVTPTCLEPIDSSSGNSCLPITSPPVLKTSGSSQKVTSTSKLCLHTSTPLQVVVNNSSNESLSIFGGTPFRRSIESPSAWKSPWFMNSFLPGPRIETEITIEDIGYFMSPGDRSYDALGLMKHVSEHSASVFANAEEVLGNDTPKQKSIDVGNPDQENQNADQPTETSSNMASNVLIERRTLDFSECGTPGKSKEKGKSSTAMMSFSSPSSYLLKGCR